MGVVARTPSHISMLMGVVVFLRMLVKASATSWETVWFSSLCSRTLASSA
eukprot:CAMPEP_0196596750 /NCGR_PEP_ID=MMETSP1081-20130531/87693_1 /TAXON_ID=36882 /ORGANISM="Pyramimonas amylifera, Strain CCMP720" /LENGTH=49 /DNA_ID= /DNA_START= /DNA_END= /DNA_ORIENTATION=